MPRLMPQAERALRVLILLCFALELSVSGNLLAVLGIPYTEDGGSFLMKLHPGSYVAGLAAAVSIVSHGPVRLILLAPEMTAFTAGIVFCIIYAAAMTGAGGLVALLDSFLPAGLAGLALAAAPASTRPGLARVLRCLFVLNASLAIIEALLGQNFILVPTDTGLPPQDFRPTALFDHPLTGAAATCMAFFLAPVKPGWSRFAYQALMLAALLVFGGRVAFASTMCAVIAESGAQACRAVLVRKHLLRIFLPIIAFGMTAAGAGAAALTLGLGGRLAAHAYWDASANMRLAQWSILGALDWPSLVFGCRRADLIALLEPMRLTYGGGVIESFWLLMILTLGCFGVVVFIIAFAALITGLWKRVSADGRWMIALFLIVASGSNSLARKSTLLTTLVGCAYVCSVPKTAGRERFARKEFSVWVVA